MQASESLYENPAPPTALHKGAQRIFAQVAYKAVRQAQTCPVVHTETLTLAAHYPICWLNEGERRTLVALRSLLPGGKGHPPGIPTAPAALPLALQSYPFVVGHAAQGATVMLDDVFADEPTDVGAPILTAQGKLTKGAEVRLRAAAIFQAGLEMTDALTEALGVEGCLEPWHIDPKALPPEVHVPNLLVIGPVDKVSERLFRVLRSLGPVAGAFISAHRISLYRISVLVQSAKAETAPPLKRTAQGR